ncbi:MAG: stage II sporulation protein M [Pseudomonadota bacterium]
MSPPPSVPKAGQAQAAAASAQAAAASASGEASAGPMLKSARFRQEREASWKRLEGLLAKLERSGPGALTPEELIEAPQLYRSTLSSLSVARSYVFDGQLVAYLESLATRAHLLIYAPRERFFGMVARLVGVEAPRAIRALWAPILIAAAMFFLGLFIGRALVLSDPTLYGALVSEGMAQGRSPEASRAEMIDSIDGHEASLENLRSFALFLLNNNVLVALTAFGFGIALGLPTMLILFLNGALLGAMLAAFATHGLEAEFIAWLTVHGTTELTAIILAGGGGLAIAGGMLFPPPRQSRLSAAAVAGRRASLLALVAIIMLFVAAFLEAFVRDTVTDYQQRLLIGAVFGAFWLAYFVGSGRRRDASSAGSRPQREARP